MSTKFCTQCGTSLESKARFCKACGTAVSSTDPSRSSRSQKQARKPFPWTILLLVVGSILIALAVGISLYSDDSTTTVDIPDDHDASGLPYPEVPRISVPETKEKFDSGTAVIVDVRGSDEYAEAHITNALSIPMGELQIRTQELAKDAEIILYCT